MSVASNLTVVNNCAVHGALHELRSAPAQRFFPYAHASQVLLATCHDTPPLEELRQQAGNVLALEVTAQGSVTWSEGSLDEGSGKSGSGGDKKKQLKMSTPKWCAPTSVLFSVGVLEIESKAPIAVVCT